MSPTSRAFAAFYVLLGVALCGLVYLTEREPDVGPLPLSDGENDQLVGFVSGLTALVLGVQLAVSRWRPAWLLGRLRRAAPIVVALGVLFAAGLYFYSGRAVAQRNYPKFWDSYHYLLGAKYEPELGYSELYRCHLVADAERVRPRFAADAEVRDLDTSAPSTAIEQREKADCSRFTPERWAEFRHDLDLFDRFTSRDALGDRGYNGTPFHATVAGALARLPTLTYSSVLALTFLDILGLCLMLAGFSWAFGWELAALSALFLFTNYNDRFDHIGASYFRYVWLVCLGLGLSFLHRRRAGAAAALLTASAFLNVFPVLYLGGLGVKAAWTLARERRIDPFHRRFFAWATAATLVWGGLSLATARPVERYQAFFAQMETHAPLLTRNRVGARYLLLWEGEVKNGDGAGNYTEKQERLERLRPAYVALVVVGLGLGAWVLIGLGDLQATILAGFLSFFLGFSTVEYYYASAVVLVPFWAGQLGTRRARAMLTATFAMSALVMLAWNLTHYPRFCSNYASTAMYGAWLAAVLGTSTWARLRRVPPG